VDLIAELIDHNVVKQTKITELPLNAIDEYLFLLSMIFLIPY